MLKSEKLSKITGHITFVIIFIFFSTLEAKNLDKYAKADNIADYFSGILLLNQSKYTDSYQYFKKLDGLEDSHPNYSRKYIYSLINSGNFSQAFSFAKKLNREVTIRHLATHTSGIAYSFTAIPQLRKIYAKERLSPYFFIDNFEALQINGNTVVSSGKSFPDICTFSAALASKAPLMHQPGVKYTYSMGMDVLGCVIERASGMKFDAFLEEKIFKPLQMNDTSFSVPASKVDRFTSLYAYPGDLGRLIPEMEGKIPDDLLMIKIDDRSFSPYLKPATLFDGGSGLVSSTEDYLKFAQMLLNGGKLGEQRIISRKSVELMSGNHLPDSFSSDAYLETAGGYRRGAGIGLTVGVLTDPAKAGQFGSKGMFFWGGAASTIFWIDPEEELVAVLMTQVLGSSERLRETYSALVYQAIDD